MRSLNPSDPDYQLQKLMAALEELRGEVRTIRANSHAQGGPIDGTTESFMLDPNNPHLVIYTSALVDPTAHVVSVPFSTLMVPDPANPHVVILPTLNV